MLRGPDGRLRNRLALALALVAFAVMVLGAGGAVLCTETGLKCHLRERGHWTLEDDRGYRGGSQWIDPSLTASLVISGLDFPTDFDFLRDGRIIVASRTGLIELVRDGKVVKPPVLDLRRVVSTWGFRGLVALAVDRSRTSPAEFYVVYSVTGPKMRDQASDEPTTARLSRFTLVGDVADRSSEQILVGRVRGGSCLERPTADCLPADHDHIGADIAFMQDGTLLVSTGDGGPAPANVELAQSLDSLAGKILRVDRDGHGVPGNPFWNGDRTSNRSRVWAYGFRNPFRMALMPDGGLIVGDVGYNEFEELDLVQRGQDYGWPCFEGDVRDPEYRTLEFCSNYYREHVNRSAHPWFALPHPHWESITAGTSLAAATKMPRALRNSYLFGDWSTSTLWVANLPAAPGGSESAASQLRVLERGAAGPVRIRVGPDGAVYVLETNVGELWRITARGR